MRNREEKKNGAVHLETEIRFDFIRVGSKGKRHSAMKPGKGDSEMQDMD
jgi:hypothetical protein